MNKERLEELKAIGEELAAWAEDEDAVLESMENAKVFTPDICELPTSHNVRVALERGRPGIGSKPQGSSPKIQFRISEDLNALLEERAAQENKSKSEVVREALASYLIAA